MEKAKDLCFLVEDHDANREWMINALNIAFGDVQIVTANNLREARAWLNENEASVPDMNLALIDLGLPDGSGIDLIKEICDKFPHILVVVASIYDDDQHLFDAISAGAKGYLLKDQETDVMVHYLQRIQNGEPPLSPSIARKLLGHFQVQKTKANEDVVLTNRETETLTLLARGLTINEAAKMLGLSPQTIASYVKVIYQKLNISSRAEATLKAVARGLV